MSEKPKDFTPDQKILHEGISEAVGLLQMRQLLQMRHMHTADMTEVFDWWAKWSRDATKTSDSQR